MNRLSESYVYVRIGRLKSFLIRSKQSQSRDTESYWNASPFLHEHAENNRNNRCVVERNEVVGYSQSYAGRTHKQFHPPPPTLAISVENRRKTRPAFSKSGDAPTSQTLPRLSQCFFCNDVTNLYCLSMTFVKENDRIEDANQKLVGFKVVHGQAISPQLSIINTGSDAAWKT